MADLPDYDHNAKPSDSFDPLPVGWYKVAIEESDVKDTATPGGKLVWLKLRVLEGDYAGRFLFGRVNVINANPKAQEIGQRELASIRLATGINSPKSTEELHNIPLWIRVAVKPAGPDKTGVHRDAQNEIKEWASLAAGPRVAAPAPVAAAGAPVAQAKPANGQAQPVGAGAGAGANPLPWQR